MSAVSRFIKQASPQQIDAAQAIARGLVEKMMEKRSANLTKLAELEAEVLVHSTAAHLGHYKQNLDRGMCWQCGNFPPAGSSTYLRCSNCED